LTSYFKQKNFFKESNLPVTNVSFRIYVMFLSIGKFSNYIPFCSVLGSGSGTVDCILLENKDKNIYRDVVASSKQQSDGLCSQRLSESWLVQRALEVKTSIYFQIEGDGWQSWQFPRFDSKHNSKIQNERLKGPDSERHSISDKTVNTGALLIA
jgi:hypothetical protein